MAGWRILHQTGESGFQRTRDLYRELRIEANIVPFVSDTPSLLAESDLAVSRAGGTTLAELAAAAVPTILVPYPHAADDHQRKNAEAFAAAGACLIVDHREHSDSLDGPVADAMRAILADPARRAAMADAMYRLARPQAARDVADRILAVAGRTLATDSVDRNAA